MKLFKQNKLVAAMAAGLAIASGNVGAVALNADGTGEALVYPYYTARGDQTTLLTVVNTTNNAKAVKVRFREARNSNDVLDFNLYLSPFDVWTGGVTAKNGGAYLTTSDTSCTNPVKSGWDAIDATNRVYGKGFFPYDYDSVDGTTASSQGLGRTLEGYVEIIEMATIPSGNAFFTAIKHVNGVPPCDSVAGAAALFGTGTVNDANLRAPSGGLFGAVTQLNTAGGANGGVSTSEAAVAYTGFARQGQVQDPSSANPNFADHNSCRALVSDGATAALMNTESPVGNCDANAKARAFAAVNMASAVQGEFSFFATGTANGTGTHGTDWIITMPGKHYFTNLNRFSTPAVMTSTGDDHGNVTGTSTSLALAPFLNPTTDGTALWNRTDKVSCLTISSTTYSREEDTAGSAGSGFSPRPPGTRPNSLCYEANIISFGAPATTGGPSAVHASPLALWLNNSIARGTAGWMDLPLTVAGATRQIGGPVAFTAPNPPVAYDLTSGAAIAAANVTVSGLPVIGFRSTVSRFTTGSPQNNYNDSVPLTLRRTVTIAP